MKRLLALPLLSSPGWPPVSGWWQTLWSVGLTKLGCLLCSWFWPEMACPVETAPRSQWSQAARDVLQALAL